MRNTLLIGLFSFTCAMNTFAAEPFFQAPPPINNNSGNSSALSPDDFAKQAADIGQKSQADAQQQLNKQIANMPKPVQYGPAPIPQSSPAPQTTTTTVETQTNTQTAPAPIVQQNVAPTPQPAPQQSAAPAPRQQTYTGFIGGSTNSPTHSQPATSGTGSSSGGWNIKY